MPSISVMVPVYQTASYLKQCIDSILCQTFESFEVILINDGSKDDSGRILAEYKTQFPEKIRVIEQENHGISYTRNRGIREAVGEYICFLDSDDWVADHYLEALFSAVSQWDADMAVCDYQETSDEKLGRVVSIPDFPRTCLKENPQLLFEVNSSPWNKIYRRSFLVKNKLWFPEGLKYEDAAFVLPAMVMAKKIVKVNETLLFYRIRQSGETMQVDKHVFDIFAILDQIYEVVMRHPDREALQGYLEFFSANRLTVYNLQQAYQKEAKLAMPFIDRSFAYLNEKFPLWKKNPHFRQDNSIVERWIKTSVFLTKCYVKMRRRMAKS